MAERRAGAGSQLSGVLERSPQLRAEPAAEADESSPAEPRGRGATPKSARTPAPRAAKRIKGRTVYIPDDLFERIIVQAHRRDVTISDYVCLLLERHVPDHRVVRSGPGPVAQESGETDAA